MRNDRTQDLLKFACFRHYQKDLSFRINMITSEEAGGGGYQYFQIFCLSCEVLFASRPLCFSCPCRLLKAFFPCSFLLKEVLIRAVNRFAAVGLHVGSQSFCCWDSCSGWIGGDFCHLLAEYLAMLTAYPLMIGVKDPIPMLLSVAFALYFTRVAFLTAGAVKYTQ